MDANPIPDEVRRFILMSGLTVPDLEALLLLREHRAAAQQPLSLAARLYISSSQAENVLARLLRLGAVETTDEAGFFYRPLTDELGSTLDRVLLCYTRHLVQVSQLIHSTEPPSTETQSAQAFADAFRIRKET